MSDPGWKRNGRNGPLDWWLSCNDHGYNYRKGCMSCDIVEDHNIEFQAKLTQEREFERECAEIDEADRRFPLE